MGSGRSDLGGPRRGRGGGGSSRRRRPSGGPGRRRAGREASVRRGEASLGVDWGRGGSGRGAPRRAVHGGWRFRRQAQLATAVALAVMAQDARAAQGGVLRPGQARPRDRGGARSSRATRAGDVVANLGTALLSMFVCAWMVREKMRHT